MKRLILIGFGLLTAIATKAQNSECKILKMKMSDGSQTSMVRAPGYLGKFMVGKYQGNFTMFYSVKDLLVPDYKNEAVLRIDSVKLIFTDNTSIPLKVFSGIGTMPNTNREIQPHLMNAQFGFGLIPGSNEEAMIRQKNLKAFIVVAEKGAQFGDTFNEKQQATLKQSFTCLL